MNAAPARELAEAVVLPETEHKQALCTCFGFLKRKHADLVGSQNPATGFKFVSIFSTCPVSNLVPIWLLTGSVTLRGSRTDKPYSPIGTLV
jgi:hypothetical protein